MISLEKGYWNNLERNEPLVLPHTTLKIFEISHKHKYKNENYKSSRIKGACLHVLGLANIEYVMYIKNINH